MKDDVDEDDLLAELEEMEQEELDKELLEVTPAEPLPSLPTPSSQIPTSSKAVEEDDEMAELAAWANWAI